MQRNDRETVVVNRRQERGQIDIVGVGVHAKFQRRKIKMKLAINRSAQRRNRELGDIERHAVGAVSAASADAGSVEPVIRHGDIRRGVGPGHRQAVIHEMPVAGEFDLAGGSAWVCAAACGYPRG